MAKQHSVALRHFHSTNQHECNVPGQTNQEAVGLMYHAYGEKHAAYLPLLPSITLTNNENINKITRRDS